MNVKKPLKKRRKKDDVSMEQPKGYSHPIFKVI
jgi:hypothetical protein